MKELAAVLSIIALVVVNFWYVPLIWRRRVHPAPATYIIAVVAFWIASSAHLAVPELSLWEKLLANVTLYGATIQATFILLVIIFTYRQSGELKVAFDWVQKLCLTGMAGGVLYWIIHREQQGVPYWTTQILLVVGYMATIGKALQKKSAFDSIGNWFFISLGGGFGLIPAIMMGDWYSIGNAMRAVVMSGFTAMLLIHYDRKAGFARWKAEVSQLRKTYGLYRFVEDR